ncbi:MAG: hypothetical protein KDN19_12655 [Verrucomicrobiae bacterium]|nr:hypothetical protein [Verrucomicrobiae bacterium]
MNRFFRYLRAAFFVRERIPLLGAVPINLVALMVVFVLGFGHPAFWLLGLCAETAFLWAMVGSKRFRNLVEARDAWADNASKSEARHQLIAQLTPPNQDRHGELARKLNRVSDYYEKFTPGDAMADENLANLETLESVYLKLLIARQHLDSADSDQEVANLTHRIHALEADIADDPEDTAPSLRESKAATLDLLKKRRAVFRKRSAALEEIDSDLVRIEAQFDLATDAAAIRAQPVEAQLDLDLASRMMAAPEYLDFSNGLTSHDESVGGLETDS